MKAVEERAHVFTDEFVRIIYCYSEAARISVDLYCEEMREFFPSLERHAGLPDADTLRLTDNRDHKLVIIDDLMKPALDSAAVLDLFTTQGHHNNSRGKLNVL